MAHRVRPRPRAGASAAELAAALEPHASTLNWLQYGETRSAKLDVRQVARQGPMLRAVWLLTSGRLVLRRATIRGACAALGASRAHWFRVPADRQSWEQAMAARLSVLLWHVARGAGRRDRPRWFAELALPPVPGAAPQAQEEVREGSVVGVPGLPGA